MRAILPRQEFQDALNAVSALTSGRTTREIFKCVKLASFEDHIELSATDGEVGLHLEVPVLSMKKPTDVVVRADRLIPVVREMPEVEISLEADDRYCTIRGEGSEIRLFVTEAEDFPSVPVLKEEADLVIGGADLRRMVSLTLYAAARESSRYAINGVLWQKRENQFFVVATDGRRLARAGDKLGDGSGGDFEAILPAKAMSVFERVFVAIEDEEDKVEVKFMPNQVLLRSGQRVLSSVLVEGNFPKYEEVIPTEHDKVARIGRDVFLAAVRRAAVLTTEDSRAVKLAFEEGKLVITSQTPEEGDARVEIPIAYEGKALAIGFNPAFLSDALRVVPYEEIVFELHEAFRPGVLSGGDREEFLYVVMPVSLAQ